MRRASLLFVVIFAAASTAPADDAGIADRQAGADGLAHSAQGLLLTPDAPARAQRLVLLTQMAAGLDPEHYQAHALLAEIRQSQQRHALAADALAVCLAQTPADQFLWRKWLFHRSSAVQTADDRRAFLDGVIRDNDAPAAIRADALVRYADVLVGQGHTRQAADIYRGALRFDPYHAEALMGWLSLQTAPVSAVDQCNLLLRVVRASPLDEDATRDLAVLLGAVGLWNQAIDLFDVTYQIVARRAGGDGVDHAWLVEYCNAMLDAGQYQRAADTFRPMLQRFPTSLDLRVMLIEAYARLDKPEGVQEMIRQVEVVYEPEPVGVTARGYDIDMAMFYLTVRPDSTRAMHHARRATADLPDPAADTLGQRLLGAAELVNGIDGGEDRLRSVAAQDAYAAYFLARHAAQREDAATLVEAIGHGAAQGRSGPAFRLLAELAGEHNIPIEPAPGSSQIRQQLAAMGPTAMAMAAHPERFLTVTLTAPPATAVGEPLTIAATLTNPSSTEVPLGEAGLCAPVMALTIKAGRDGTVFDTLPMLVWASPKYLAPGESLTASVRIDVGPLGDYLAERSLGDVKLTVSGTLDPVQRDQKTLSALPSIRIEPVSVVRTGWLPAVLDEDPYPPLHARLAGAVTGEALADRLKAAREIGSLLTALAGLDADGQSLPEIVPQETMHADLIALARQLIEDPSEAVRAEMLAALHGALRADRLVLAAALADDPSPLVRLREAELIGLSTQAREDVRLKALSSDPNNYVARMAEAMLAEIAGAEPAAP